MAIDTRLKRSSAINVGSPWRSILPAPDGVVDQADRQATALHYSGILAAGAVAFVETPGGGVPSIKPEIEAWRLAYVRHRRRRFLLLTTFPTRGTLQ